MMLSIRTKSTSGYKTEVARNEIPDDLIVQMGEQERQITVQPHR